MSRRQRVDVWVATAPRHSPSLPAVGWSTTIKSATSGPGTLAVSRPARRSSCRLRTQAAVAGEVGGCVGAGIGQVPRRPQHPATAVARCDGAPTRRRLTGQRPRWRPVRPGSGRRRSFHDENLDGPPIPPDPRGDGDPWRASPPRVRGPRPGTLAPGHATCHDAPMAQVPQRILMGPGPSNPYPEVTAALVHPVLGHLDPGFLEVLDETCDRLRTVFRTANALTLPSAARVRPGWRRRS